MNRRRAIWGLALLGGSGLAVGSRLVWLPWFQTPDLAFLRAQQPLLAALTETILPATDTPGAIEAGVPAYVLAQLLNNATPLVQNRFVAGLKAVERYCVERYGKRYAECNFEQQIALMQRIEAEGEPRGGFLGKVDRKLLGDSFFSLLKNYTCVGYYTSQLGATCGLAYSAVPGRYAGCQPLMPGQKAWATK